MDGRTRTGPAKSDAYILLVVLLLLPPLVYSLWLQLGSQSVSLLVTDANYPRSSLRQTPVVTWLEWMG